MIRKKKAEDKSQEAKINEVTQAYKDAFSSPAGKIVLADLENRYSVGSFKIRTSDNIDPFKTHLDLGKLMVFGHIKNQIDRELLEEQEDE
jgi:hypothetical protein